MRTWVALAVALAATLNAAFAEVLIVTDEFPAMEVVAAKRIVLNAVIYQP
jgi:hypothetical protein